MSNRSPEKLKIWLDKLQQESWQLELILTGFAIFLILGLKEPLDELMNNALRISLASSKFALIFLQVAASRAVWFIIITNLVIHLFLRSLWISTIGLRYVSEDIELDQLKLAPIFKRFLQKNVKGFDHYIEGLEKICSTIFAFTFLIIFVILSCSLYYLITLTFDFFILDKLEGLFGSFGALVAKLINALIILTTTIYLIDFVSLGWIKRIKWLAPFYYPFYRFLGWITLAPLYRPLYYNLIDNRFGRWVGLLIVPYLIIALVAGSLRLQYGKYLPKEDTVKHLSNQYYEDLSPRRKMSQQALFAPSIPTKYVNNDFIELFLPYNGTIDNQGLEKMCPEISPAKKEKLILRGAINIGLEKELSYNIDTLMACFQSLYQVRIDDSTYTNKDWLIYRHPSRKIDGLIAIIDISHLKRGKHQIQVQKFGKNIFDIERSSLFEWLEPDKFPFWKTTDKIENTSVSTPNSR